MIWIVDANKRSVHCLMARRDFAWPTLSAWSATQKNCSPEADLSQLTDTTAIFNVPRGTAYITAQQLVIYASSFVYYVLLIRILNLAQIGEVSLLAAASAAFTTITQLALPLAATRFISANSGSKDPSTAGSVARTSLRLTITIAAPTLLLSVLASPWIATTVFKNSDSTSFLVVAFAASFLLDLTALYGAYFLGLDAMLR